MRKVEQVHVEHVDGPVAETRYTHPAFGSIGAFRVQSTGYMLHGSDFKHGNFIVLKIRRAQLDRGLSHDYHHPTQQVVEVALSEAQWATMISSLNMGAGVPCTLQYIVGEGEVPGLPEPRGEAEEYAAEVTQTVQDAIDRLSALLDSNPKMTKAVRHEIEMARQELRANLPYVARSFGEHMEERVEKAKVEVEAYLHGAVQRAGLQALGGTVPPIALPAPTEDEDA